MPDDNSVVRLQAALNDTEDLVEALALCAGFHSACWNDRGEFLPELASEGVRVLAIWLRAHKELL